MKSDLERANAFKALGDPTRLKIFEFLCSCAAPVEVNEAGAAHHTSGPTVGDVCCHLNGETKTTSTVSFHLKELRNAGLITMERRGKNMLCSVVPYSVSALEGYFGGISLAIGSCGNECADGLELAGASR